MNFLEIAAQYARGEITASDDRIKTAENLLAEMASCEDGRQEIAETIGIYIDQTFNRFDISPYLCKYRNFSLGDKPEFRMKKKGIRAYWIAPNSSTPKSRNVMETLTMEFETISARPECFIDELKAGRIQGFAELLGDTQEAVRNGIAAKVFELLTQVYNETKNPEMYETFSGELPEAVIEKAIDTVF